jgi:transcriptional regulator with XRE-family HTH domain
MTFYERLTELRREKGVTQKQIQEELDLGKNSFGDWKKGIMPIRSTIGRISEPYIVWGTVFVQTKRHSLP